MVARRNFLHQVASVASGTSDGRAVLLVAGICALTWLGLVYCVSVSRSLVLTGAAWLTVFALFSLASSLISLALRNDSPSESYSFGLARAPVLAVFSSTVLAQLSAIFLIKEAVERLIEGDEAHPHAHQHLFIPGTIAACVAQLLAAYAVRNDPFTHVLTAASSSWLQEHAADFSHAICYVIPGASRLLLPRLNPLALLTSCAAVCCLVVHYLVVRQAVWWADPVGALCLSFAVFGSLWPLSTYTGRILLQTSPPHVLNQLDRCVREASTLDGVLELRNAHFWQLDFSSMAGSVDVRVRRDADEQMVLAHVVEKLSAVVSTLTVSVVKDTDFASALAAPWHAAVAPTPTPATAASHHGHSHGHGHSHDDDDDHHGHSHDHHGHSHDHHGHSHDDEHVIHHDHH